jgi:quercetin dioxygenase-like cupin family protein
MVSREPLPSTIGVMVEIEDEPRHHLVFSNEFVRGFAVEVAPHERTLCHHHPNDYLLYVASGAEIISAARNEEPKRLCYGDGECELLPAGLIHVVENLSDTPFRNVVVELLPRAGELRRGAAPRAVVAEGHELQLLKETRVTQLFDDARAAIFSIEIEPGTEVAIAGPAVTAAPYHGELSRDTLSDAEVNHDPICDLAWIAPEQEAVLHDCWKETATVIVFQIGRADQ